MSLVLEWHGEELLLLPEKAIFWAAQRTLFVADLHLAKGATLRAGGIPVPPGSSMRTLERLGELIDRHQPKEVLILGDLFHGREAGLPENMRAFDCWQNQVGVPMTLVAGNHDRWVKKEDVPLESHALLERGPFRLTHHPVDGADHPMLCGHLHPGFLLLARGRRAEKVPCFWVQQNQIVLPAFGEFTGLYLIDPSAGDRVFVPAGSRVLEVPIRKS